MEIPNFGYSPNITIYLDSKQNRIRLADVLLDTAILRDPPDYQLAAGTECDLVFLIEDHEDRQSIILSEPITQDSYLVRFSYMKAIKEIRPYNKQMERRQNTARLPRSSS